MTPERGQRFDDTFWGRTFRFWPLILAIFWCAFFLEQKLERDETRLTIVELQLSDLKNNVDGINENVKILVRRR